MAKEKTPERSAGSPEVIVISITETQLSAVRGSPLSRRLAGSRTRVALAIALASGVLGTIVATAVHNGARSRSTGAHHAQPQPAEKAAIAAALGYPYPPRCLTVAISTSNPEYARAAVDRTKGCGRYHGYLNASLDRVDGTWRLVLDEGQLFVPNSLFTPCRPGPAGCGQRSLSSRR